MSEGERGREGEREREGGRERERERERKFNKTSSKHSLVYLHVTLILNNNNNILGKPT